MGIDVDVGAHHAIIGIRDIQYIITDREPGRGLRTIQRIVAPVKGERRRAAGDRDGNRAVVRIGAGGILADHIQHDVTAKNIDREIAGFGTAVRIGDGYFVSAGR